MELAREAAALFEMLMEEKSQRLVLEGDEQRQVEGDAIFLRQALVNILHNAVKYSPARRRISVAFAWQVAARSSSRSRTTAREFRLEDQPQVFDRFYRVDKARWRESGGAGLGLSIAKWAVEAHGGTITLESLPNRARMSRLKSNCQSPPDRQRTQQVVPRFLKDYNPDDYTPGSSACCDKQENA